MKKILIVEDNDFLLEEIVDWFLFEGYETFSATNGKTGLDLAKKHLPDLILCDIMMPEMDGMQMLNHLKTDLSTRLIPFIFMTALSERSYVRSGMELGADDYIPKPFTRFELLNAVNSRIAKSVMAENRTKSELDQLRNSLLLSLPHELRTPLNGIMGYGQILKDSTEIISPEELRTIGEVIYQSSERLFHLIKNYLLFAQLELRKKEEFKKAILQNPASVLSDACRKKAFEYDRQEDLILEAEEGRVSMNEEEFRIMAEELVDNGFKFSSKGSPVKISCGQKNNSFTIIIEDHGVGITRENISRIGAYMQFDREKQAQQGSGLGLIISKKIVNFHNGTFSMQSEPGKGTKIEVTLPS